MYCMNSNGFQSKKHKKRKVKNWKSKNERAIIVKDSTNLLKNDYAECTNSLCIFCAKIQLDLKTTLIVIVVADEQVKKITNTLTNTFKHLPK